MKMIRTGQMVQIDGDAGVVRLSATPEQPATAPRQPADG